MPSKVDKIKLNDLDRRIKLTSEQKDEIRKLYATGVYSQGDLAKLYKVSRSLIGIIVNSDRAEKVKNRIKTHWKDYSDREKLTKAMQATRKYKKQLLEEGLLERSDDNAELGKDSSENQEDQA